MVSAAKNVERAASYLWNHVGGRVRAAIAAGEDPYAVAVDAKTGQVFTANYGIPALIQVKMARRAADVTQ